MSYVAWWHTPLWSSELYVAGIEWVLGSFCWAVCEQHGSSCCNGLMTLSVLPARPEPQPGPLSGPAWWGGWRPACGQDWILPQLAAEPRGPRTTAGGQGWVLAWLLGVFRCPKPGVASWWAGPGPEVTSCRSFGCWCWSPGKWVWVLYPLGSRARSLCS